MSFLVFKEKNCILCEIPKYIITEELSSIFRDYKINYNYYGLYNDYIGFKIDSKLDYPELGNFTSEMPDFQLPVSILNSFVTPIIDYNLIMKYVSYNTLDKLQIVQTIIDDFNRDYKLSFESFNRLKEILNQDNYLHKCVNTFNKYINVEYAIFNSKGRFIRINDILIFTVFAKICGYDKLFRVYLKDDKFVVSTKSAHTDLLGLEEYKVWVNPNYNGLKKGDEFNTPKDVLAFLNQK